jgi:hypothetical protein
LALAIAADAIYKSLAPRRAGITSVNLILLSVSVFDKPTHPTRIHPLHLLYSTSLLGSTTSPVTRYLYHLSIHTLPLLVNTREIVILASCVLGTSYDHPSVDVRLGHSVNVGVVVISSSQIFQQRIASASTESFGVVARGAESLSRSRCRID